MLSTDVFNELCVKITLLRSIPKKIQTMECDFLPLCIDLMHINPPHAADGFDGSYHPSFAERSSYVIQYGTPRVMGAIISLGCNS